MVGILRSSRRQASCARKTVEIEKSYRAPDGRRMQNALFENTIRIGEGTKYRSWARGYRNLSAVKLSGQRKLSRRLRSLLDLLDASVFDHSRPIRRFIFYQFRELGRCIA